MSDLYPTWPGLEDQPVDLGLLATSPCGIHGCTGRADRSITYLVLDTAELNRDVEVEVWVFPRHRFGGAA